LRLAPPPGFAQQPSAVDDERRSGYEVGVREIEDRVRDVVRGADPSEQRLGSATLDLVRLDGHRARRDPAHARLGC